MCISGWPETHDDPFVLVLPSVGIVVMTSDLDFFSFIDTQYLHIFWI